MKKITETEKTLDAANFMYNSQGYVDINTVAKFVGIPVLICENVIKQNGYKKTVMEGQYIKQPREASDG